MDTNITTNMDTTICMQNLCRQVEDEDGEVEDADAGDDQVHNVEKGLSTDLQVEENIWRSSEHLQKILDLCFVNMIYGVLQ